MKPVIYFLFISLLSSQLFAQEYLLVGDVQDDWLMYDGSIDNAVMLVTPKGLYAQYEVYLDFSVNCTPFTDPQDSLEIQMGFRLPAEAEVIDLWLWINGIPVQADMYDRWTASQIYESFVDRRTDPALLVKQSDTDYELHIFPMMVNLPRKIKMTFLLPLNKLTGSQSLLTLPLNILKLSTCPIGNMQVAVKPEVGLDFPSFLELPQETFQFVNDSLFGQCYTMDLNDISQLSSLTLSFNDTDASNHFAAYHQDSTLNEGVYELELDLASVLGLPVAKKTLFLIDFIDANSSLGSAHVIKSLKNYIATWFNPGDSVNFMFSDFYTKSYSNTWVPADSSSLTQIFTTLDSTYISNTSNLPLLLIDGMNYIQSHENKGNIVLIASSNEYSDIDASNDLFEEVIDFMGPQKIPIHIINLDDVSYTNFYGTNQYYRGNEYLYSNLATYTGAEFQTILETLYDINFWYYESIYTTYETMLGTLFPKLTDYFTALDVYTTLQSGFTYSNYDLNSMTGFVYFGSPFRQTGKYYGSFPMEITISAVTSGGQLYNSQINLEQAQLYTLDSAAKNLWAAQYIRSMLAYMQTSSVVAEIIQASKDERVLCKYTALLALEPGTATVDTVFIPVTAGTIAVGIEEPSTNADIKCYPNPATSIVVFEFDSDKSEQVEIEVYNLYGEKIATILNDLSDENYKTIQYDVSNLTAGIYIYRLRIKEKLAATGKLVVAK
jgi:hypothetical protein